MKNLIDNLMMHANNKNMSLIEELTKFIIKNKIDNANQLKDTNDVDKLFNRIKKSLTRWDYLLPDEVEELYKLESGFEKLENNEKIKRLIKIHLLLNYELIYKYETYNMIVNNEL